MFGAAWVALRNDSFEPVTRALIRISIYTYIVCILTRILVYEYSSSLRCLLVSEFICRSCGASRSSSNHRRASRAARTARSRRAATPTRFRSTGSRERSPSRAAAAAEIILLLTFALVSLTKSSARLLILVLTGNMSVDTYSIAWTFSLLAFLCLNASFSLYILSYTLLYTTDTLDVFSFDLLSHYVCRLFRTF